MSNGICINCKWWVCKKPDELHSGDCRKTNPVYVTTGDINGSVRTRAAWPQTKGRDFCGQFEPRGDRAAKLLGSKYMSKDEAA